MMKYVVFALMFALLGAVFALQNSTAVTVSFAVWSFETSLVLIVLGSAIVGAMISMLLAAPMQIRLRWALDKAKRRSAELETKLAEHEAKPPAVQAEAALPESNKSQAESEIGLS